MHVRRVRLGPSHVPTGYTRHDAGGELIPAPAELHIVRMDGDPGFLLLYLDEQGNEMTDTYHESLERALEQARREFGVEPSEWQMFQE
ncbi:MAG: hypothetical protein H0T89_14015 [Deltaproteobacteria bacterium]|nr:hypothetical protein [Deltaproteobacteria bacterium]